MGKGALCDAPDPVLSTAAREAGWRTRPSTRQVAPRIRREAILFRGPPDMSGPCSARVVHRRSCSRLRRRGGNYADVIVSASTADLTVIPQGLRPRCRLNGVAEGFDTLLARGSN